VRLPLSVQIFVVAKQSVTWSALLLQRHARPELALPDFWQGISGALESGESFENAAVREVYEETSIQLSSVSFTGFEQAFPIKPEWRKAYGPEPTHVQEKVFFAVVPKAVEPKLSREHKSFRWCCEPEAIALLTFANNARCAQAVFQALGDAGA
jgi:dATP pyrophosphohydrolase